MLYQMIEIAINAKETDGLIEKIDALHSAGRLSDEERDRLVALLDA